MGSVAASDIINRAKRLLQQTNVGSIRWDDVELLDHLNEGQREVVRFDPRAFIKTASVQLVPGIVQKIPSDGVQFVTAYHNMGADGATPGAAVTPATRQDLDNNVPDWPTAGPGPVVHYVYDDIDPFTFMVYPPQPNPAEYLMIAYSAVPTDIGLTSTISVPDTYQSALLNYVMYRAHSKDTDTSSPERAAAYYTAFMNLMGAQRASS